MEASRISGIYIGADMNDGRSCVGFFQVTTSQAVFITSDEKGGLEVIWPGIKYREESI